MNLDNIQSDLQPKTGRCLVSAPLLGDKNFERSVILLCDHSKDGTYGLVVNKVIENIGVEDIVNDLEGVDIPVFLGGPVEPDILQFIHQNENVPDATEILPGLYVGGDFSFVREQLKAGTMDYKKIKFLLGYSGWDDGQLKVELEANTWVVADVKAEELLISDPDTLWRRVLKNMGGKFKVFSNFPEDPRMN